MRQEAAAHGWPWRARWVGCLALVLLVHAGVVVTLLGGDPVTPPPPPQVPAPPATPAILLALEADTLAAPAAKPVPDPVPAPPVPAEPPVPAPVTSPLIPAPPDPAPPAPPPPTLVPPVLPLPPLSPTASAAAAVAAVLPRETPVRLARRQAAPVPRKAPSRPPPPDVRPPETSAPSAPPQQPPSRLPAPAAEPAARPATPGDPHALPTWQGQVLRRLQAVRRYPQTARDRDEQGVAMVTFSLTRDGHVLSASLARSSGSAILDLEAIDMIRRADPLPVPPPEVAGTVLTLSLPVRFSLR